MRWFKTKDQTGTPLKQPRRTPKPRDYTDSLQVNAVLTKGLYHNTYPGLKLAGGLAFNPIAIPVYFMGYPVIKDEALQDEIDNLIETRVNDMQQIHVQDHREGTIWIYPKLKDGALIWEQIPDETVSDIIRDIDSGEVLAIITDEDLRVTVGFNENVTVRRTRRFTENRVTVTYTGGQIPEQLKDRTMRNPVGILPIAFSNNNDGDEVRGHSDYERILPDLKDYHDISLARSEMLAKFKVKMLQQVANVKDWLTNNGYDDISEIDISTIDLIMNLEDESTAFAFPSQANQTYKDTLSQIFKKIVEGSGIPEIAWGLKTQGNMASVEENMSILLMYVADKRRQKTEQYKALYTASLRLLGFEDPDITVGWDDFDSMSQKEQVAVFASFAEGVAKLAGAAMFTKEQIFAFWQMWYPKQTEEDFDEFVAGLSDMALFKGFASADYLDQLDASGDGGADGTGEEE